MAPSSSGSLAERVARQLGVKTAPLGGTGPGGAATLSDVLREAGRALPVAARPPPPRAVSRAGEDPPRGVRRLETTCDARPVRDACDALAPLVADVPEPGDVVVRLCGAALGEFPELAGVRVPDGEAPRRGSIVIGVAGPARTVPLPGADEAGIASVREAVRAAGAPSRTGSSGPGASGAGPEPAFVVRTTGSAGACDASSDVTQAPGGAKLSFAERSGSLVLVLELGLDAAPEVDAEAFLGRLRTLCLDPRRALL